MRYAAGFRLLHGLMAMTCLCGAGCSGDADRPVWVAVPGGTFVMGSAVHDADEAPAHEVAVQGFEMMRTEVTVAMFEDCVEAGRCAEPGTGYVGCNWDEPGKDDHPVNCVDWQLASDYCSWMGARLPTEAEWEYAARSGGLSTLYPWGDDEPTCALAVLWERIYVESSGCDEDGTWRVCMKRSGNTAQGLCDMAGNVSEWVLDWYHDSYAGAPADGSAWVLPATDLRVKRGGSFMSQDPDLLRAGARFGDVPANRLETSGFRCVAP